MKKLISALCALVVLTGPGAALAVETGAPATTPQSNAMAPTIDVAKEIATAQQHADLAAAATDIKAVHMHLTQVINCLVGPSGKAYVAGATDPCTGMGNGALSDTMKTNVTKNRALERALDRAQSGLKEDELKAAQRAGVAVSAMLKKVA